MGFTGRYFHHWIVFSVVAIAASRYAIHLKLEHPEYEFWLDPWYWFGMIVPFIALIYCLNIRCENQNCLAPQVFRKGLLGRGWGVPKKTCWKCGHSLLHR